MNAKITSKSTRTPPGEPEPAHIAVGSNGVVFVNVRDLRREELAFLRGKKRRTFYGIELDGNELAIVREEMNNAGGFNAATAVNAELAEQARRPRNRRRA